MHIYTPQKLRPGDTIRIIAPSCAKSTINPAVLARAENEFKKLGLRVTWGTHTNETDAFECAPISSRIQDFHDAFSDPTVKAIFAVRGGYNSNQLLDHIDWNLIRNNPKIFCGFSDITALQNALLSQAGIISYSGPNFSTLGRSDMLDYTISYLKKCLFSSDSFTVEPSDLWEDLNVLNEQWPQASSGWQVLQEGTVEGTIIGGNLCTFNLLQGTRYLPGLKNKIVFIEEDYESKYQTIDRDLQSLVHLSGFNAIKGLVLGRFQRESQMTDERLLEMIKRKPQLATIPIITNVDFGHTEPKITFPIGGNAKMIANPDNPTIQIMHH